MERRLIGKLIVSELEAAAPRVDAVDRQDPDWWKPFHPGDAGWVAFKALLSDGDELWSYHTPPESFGTETFESGVAIVRAGQIIATLISFKGPLPRTIHHG